MLSFILSAYLAWGSRCVNRLLGDFAFAIWNPKQRLLFCARDQMGVRPFYYHHTSGRFFAAASEPQAILLLPQTPYLINEGRIADFLVSGVGRNRQDQHLFRRGASVAPAHTLTVAAHGICVRRYSDIWNPSRSCGCHPTMSIRTAFLDVFTAAVSCRLRGATTVGSMLSGGMDSGSIVAVALGSALGGRPRSAATFSGVGPDPDTCVETLTIPTGL